LVSIFQDSPKETHLNVVKRIFKYLQGTLDYGLWYPKGKHFNLITLTYVDWVGSIDDKNSTSGATHFLGDCLVSWASKEQSYIYFSIAEAKYISTTTCCTHILWMKQTLQDMNVEYEEPLPIMVDNTSAIRISKIGSSFQDQAHTNQISFSKRTSGQQSCEVGIYCFK